MNSRTCAGLVSLPFMARSLFAKDKNECLSPEDEAAELQRIMQGAPGEAPPDREEMMEIMMRRQKGKKLPVFQQFMMPLKQFTMTRPIDGVSFSFAVPMSQRFQTGVTYTFSNKEESEFEINGTYMGSGSQMDEDIGFIMANSSSSGRLSM
jgi:hypothetical protein